MGLESKKIRETHSVQKWSCRISRDERVRKLTILYNDRTEKTHLDDSGKASDCSRIKTLIDSEFGNFFVSEHKLAAYAFMQRVDKREIERYILSLQECG